MTRDRETGGIMTLRVGAGRAQIELPGELFPLEGFVGVHDPLHVRTVIIDCVARVVLVSVEMTSLPNEYVALLRETVATAAGVATENVWVCVTHTMSAPHVHLTAMEGAAVGPRTADDEKNDRLAEGIEAAVRGATDQAVASLQEARLGHGSALCDVNVNRDVPTAEGWWLGVNEAGFSDKTLTVLRFERRDGHPIAILFSHCVRPAVTECQPGSRKDALVTADLAGVACAAVEEEYGEPTIALFFMGAAGDQAPRMPESGAGPSGETRGHAAAEIIGKILGRGVVGVSGSIECETSPEGVVARSTEILFQGQEMVETLAIRPAKEHVFAGGVDRLERLQVISLGEVALVGVSPELSCRTGAEIKDASPFAVTLILTMVNGAAKYMAEQTAYDRITYESRNSPFARGSAERLAGQAARILGELSDQVRHGSCG